MLAESMKKVSWSLSLSVSQGSNGDKDKFQKGHQQINLFLFFFFLQEFAMQLIYLWVSSQICQIQTYNKVFFFFFCCKPCTLKHNLKYSSFFFSIPIHQLEQPCEICGENFCKGHAFTYANKLTPGRNENEIVFKMGVLFEKLDALNSQRV